MSEDRSAQLKAKMLEQAAKAEAEKQLKDREFELRQARVKTEYDALKEGQEGIGRLATMNLSKMSDENVEALQKESAEYMEAARKEMQFIHTDFKNLVPYFMRNLILIGAQTGQGKSTVVANLAYLNYLQKDPITGERKKTLIITNEEDPADVYARIVCVSKGWHYTNHSNFTDHQKDAIKEGIKEFSQYITVIGDTHEGVSGCTTTIEGVETIFANLIHAAKTTGFKYDVVLFDYYQNVQFSKLNARLDEFKVQAKLSGKLDKWKNEYDAPIVLLCQLYSPDKDGKVPFEQRIRGHKGIMTKATCAIEMLAKPRTLETEFIFHKCRYTMGAGVKVILGFVKGQFVNKGKEYFAALSLKLKDEQSRSQRANIFDKTEIKSDATVAVKVEEKPNGN